MVSKNIQSGSLRDITIGMLDKYVLPYDKQTYTRCRYVVEENARVIQACNALANNDLAMVGQLLFQSHKGLSEEYNVSCAELDYLVQEVKDLPGVWGARMMGGGFGGCTINLIESERKDEILQAIKNNYSDKFQLDLTDYEVQVEDGTTIINA